MFITTAAIFFAAIVARAADSGSPSEPVVGNSDYYNLILVLMIVLMVLLLVCMTFTILATIKRYRRMEAQRKEHEDRKRAQAAEKQKEKQRKKEQSQKMRDIRKKATAGSGMSGSEANVAADANNGPVSFLDEISDLAHGLMALPHRISVAITQISSGRNTPNATQKEKDTSIMMEEGFEVENIADDDEQPSSSRVAKSSDRLNRK